MALSSGALTKGKTLFNDTYTIEKLIGHGGFGITYLALDGFGRHVALKECFAREYCRREGAKVKSPDKKTAQAFKNLRAAFVDEAQKLASIRHPNVVHVQHVFDENDTSYICMEYLEGANLEDTLSSGKFDVNKDSVGHLARQLLDAMSVVHAAGVLHCDIAPDNILMDAGARPVIIDFGASHELEERGSEGKTDATLRAVKTGYSAPELYLDELDVTEAADVYGLAAVFYKILTNEEPVAGTLRLAAIAEQMPDPLKPFEGQSKKFPKSLLEAIIAGLAVMPEDRPQTVKIFNDWIEGNKPRSKKPTKVAAPQTNQKKNLSGVTIAGGLGVCAAAVAGYFFLTSGDTPSPIEPVEEAEIAATSSEPTAEPLEEEQVTEALDTAVADDVAEDTTGSIASIEEAMKALEGSDAGPQPAPVAQSEAETTTAEVTSDSAGTDAGVRVELDPSGFVTRPRADGIEIVSLSSEAVQSRSGAFTEGAVIKAVAGVPVTSMDEFENAARDFFGAETKPDPLLPVSLIDFNGLSKEVSISIPVSQIVELEGTSFAQTRDGFSWTVSVAQSKASLDSRLLTGDVLRGEQTRQRVISSLVDLTDLWAENGNTFANLVFSGLREGELVIVVHEAPAATE